MVKKIIKSITLFLTPVLLSLVLLCAPLEQFCDKSGVLTPTTKTIFELCGAGDVATIGEANTFAQKNLLRKGERWDAQTSPVSEKLHQHEAHLLENVRKLGLVDGIAPEQKQYTYALVMGGLHERMAIRLGYVATLMQQGVTFDHVVLLSGQRALQQFEKDGLPNNVATEVQLFEHILKNNTVLATKPYIVVDAAAAPNSVLNRPITDTTVELFAQIAPSGGACLVVSNGQYIVRQAKVVQRLLDQKKFPTQGAGPALDNKDVDIVLLMDEFARTVYEENQGAGRQ